MWNQRNDISKFRCNEVEMMIDDGKISNNKKNLNGNNSQNV